MGFGYSGFSRGCKGDGDPRCRRKGDERRCIAGARIDWRLGQFNPSTYTALSAQGDFEPVGMNACDKQGAVDGVWGYAGRNLYFGVREHGMGAILIGLAAHGAPCRSARRF